MKNTELFEIARRFDIAGKITDVCRYGNGHINRTYLVVTDKKRYIMQKINSAVFPDVAGLMHNIAAVTKHLTDRGVETLRIVPTKDGAAYLADGNYRMYYFIENTVTLQAAETPEQLTSAAAAFGAFVNDLADFDASALVETIARFHDTPDRYFKLADAVDADRARRKAECKAEIEFASAHRDTLSRITSALSGGGLPLRVTHNDTKLNNILLDAGTGRARAIIDLDTVMPGSLLYDFGDSIRFGASTAAEDEPELDKVHFDIGLFAAYASGYLPAVKNTITPREVELIPYSAYLMTIECGMRFLTDYLDGDVYFATAYPEHNLVRCRTQFRLARETEERFGAMRDITARILNNG